MDAMDIRDSLEVFWPCPPLVFNACTFKLPRQWPCRKKTSELQAQEVLLCCVQETFLNVDDYVQC